MRVSAKSAACKQLTEGLVSRFAGSLLCLGMSILWAPAAHPQQPQPITCATGDLRAQGITIGSNGGGASGDNQPDLVVTGTCTVKPSEDYYYGKVNVISGGTLIFKEGQSSDLDKVTNFWAKSIIIENEGALKAGVDGDKPYGTNGFTLNIILYGKDRSDGDPLKKQGAGDTCASNKPNSVDCGIPKTIWDTNGSTEMSLPPGNIKDFFYQYGTIYADGADPRAHYGYKVLAVGYGGTLQLRGIKGTTLVDAADKTPTDSGTSWTRLAENLSAKSSGGSKLTLDQTVEGDWQVGDKIVVTTTDYLPSHSEELTISDVSGKSVTVVEPIKWDHVGKKFDMTGLMKEAGNRLTQAGMDPELQKAAETRAAVALLTRSIRIVSGGDFAGDYFSCPNGLVPAHLLHDKNKPITLTKDNCASLRNSNYSFGGHSVFRQGFAKLQVQGVEFHQMGQGGRKAHYPVHFHGARKAPPDTYIKDSSVNESMTRWYVLHSTQDVLLQRNVGWKSIGHGYYLEDGTEAGNKFYSNIGIYARGGVAGPENPRNVPGILAQNGVETAFRYRSDIVYPTVFWITNGWNEWVGNMAAGAGTCGICYWFLSAGNNDHVEIPHHSMKHMKWKGYAGRQTNGHEGDTPIKLFYKNYCSTAMHSLNTTSDGMSDCNAVRFLANTGETWKIEPIRSVAPEPNSDATKEEYYPKLSGNRNPTVCNPDLENDKPGACTGPWDEATGQNNNSASNVVKRCNNTDPKDCGISIIDHYTSSFNWAETNFSAIWLRSPGWYLLDHSFISDAQNGGLTFVTGGDYSRSSVALGYWALASRSIFVGATNPDNRYARAAGPPGAMSLKPGIVCDREHGGFCISKNDSVGYPLSNWGTGQRLFNIYDGPAYQDANAYLNIKVSDCDSNVDGSCLYFGTPGVRKYLSGLKQGKGYLPNAAIGWKQPNGFYYPPAFHSKNLYFNDVDIRHYVILPIFDPGTYRTADKELEAQFKGGVEGAKNMMRSFTDIDRQTELNDDDGTLTGFTNSISVNEDGFFGAPTQAAQCKSNVGIDPAVACAANASKAPTPPTARTSPYDYVTTVIYPGCAMNVKGTGDEPLDGPNSDTACGSTHKGDNVAKDGRVTKQEFRGGTWSKECSGPYCYGVPLYRQYLTGNRTTDNDGKTTAASTREWRTWFDNKCDDNPGSDKCSFPFARMAGTSTWQRSVMTVNNGKFYIDTTRSLKKQQTDDALGKPGVIEESYVECSVQKPGLPCQPRSVNVFERGKTYFVFFVFAKKDTKQTYQIYVGPNFNPATDFKYIKIPETEVRYKWAEWSNPPKWNPQMIEGATKGVKDVLQVTVDFSLIQGIDLNPKPMTASNKATCKPESFCKWNGAGSCGCALSDNDPRVLINPRLKDICTKTCGEWAVKDLDCPEGGCLGFSFKIPTDGFNADDTNRRPVPTPFPMGPSDIWSTLKFKSAGTSGGPACSYTAANTPNPTAGVCGVPDCGLGETDPPFCTKR